MRSHASQYLRVLHGIFMYFLHQLVLLETELRFAYASENVTFLGVGWMFMTCVCKTDIAAEFTVMA